MVARLNWPSRLGHMPKMVTHPTTDQLRSSRQPVLMSVFFFGSRFWSTASSLTCECTWWWRRAILCASSSSTRVSRGLRPPSTSRQPSVTWYVTYMYGTLLMTRAAVVKVGGNAWERRSQARQLCNAAFPGPIEGLFQWERTFLGPKI